MSRRGRGWTAAAEAPTLLPMRRPDLLPLLLALAAPASAQSVDELLGRAERAGSIAERIELATKALGLATDPTEKAGAYIIRSHAHADRCDDARALADADAAAAALPSDESPYLSRAQLRSAAGDCKGAFADLRKVDELMRGRLDVPAYMARAGVRERCKSPLKAGLADIDAASALSRKEGDMRAYALQRYMAARRLCNAKRFDAGLAEAAKAERTGARPVESQLAIARCLLEAGRKAEALPRLDRGIQLAESSSGRHLKSEIKDTDDAVVVTSLSPDTLIVAYSERAKLRAAAGRADDAIGDLGKAIEHHGDSRISCSAQNKKRLASLYRRRAALWSATGETLFAKEDLETACRHGDRSACKKKKR